MLHLLPVNFPHYSVALFQLKSYQVMLVAYLSNMFSLMPQHVIRLFHKCSCFETGLLNVVYFLSLSHQLMCVVEQLVLLILMLLKFLLQSSLKIEEPSAHLIKFVSFAPQLHVIWKDVLLFGSSDFSQRVPRTQTEFLTS